MRAAGQARNRRHDISARRTPLAAPSRRAIARLLALALTLGSVAVVSATPASAAAPTVSVSVSGPSTIIAGNNATYTITATNTGAIGADGFNLALVLEVPVGVEFVSSALGAPTVYTEADALTPPVPAGIERWVWEDVSDLPGTGTVGNSVTVHPSQPPMGTGEIDDEDVFPVGSTVTVNGYAYLSGDPTYLPVFGGSTGVGGPIAESETGAAGPAARSTDVEALTIDKSEPSPESELKRGVHDHSTVYRIRVTNTSEGPTDDVMLVDYIPAHLEFLGCGAEDNSTVDRFPGDPDINEYEGAPTLAASVPEVDTDCLAPLSVETVVADASAVSSHGVTLGAVYTRVTWDLGDLAAGSTTTIRYAAGIPLYANTTTWDGVGGEPDPASGDQGSNLDNNNGASTRHGEPDDHVDGDAYTNVARVVGEYGGVTRTGTDRTTAERDSESVDSMDLHILKSVSDDTFEIEGVSAFTLELLASEYMDSSDIVVVDELSNGLCPLVPAGTTVIEESPGIVTAECQTAGVVDGADVVQVEAFDDGTFRVTFRPTSVAYPDPDDFVLAANETHEISYGALNRSVYETADEYGFTTSGDGFGNYADFTASTDAITVLQGDFPDTWLVWDDSSETLGTDYTTISKLVMARDEVEQDLAPDANPCTVGSFVSSTQSGFHMGDTACFELRVDFPNSIDVRNPVISDFLPDGLTYAGHEVAPASTVATVVEDDSGVGAGRLEWQLGDLGEGGDRYVPRGSVFVAHIWATVDAPSNGPILDKPENLMKYRQQNVDGALYFLRTEASVEVDPELELVKGVMDVNGVTDRPADTEDSGEGVDFRSNRDGIVVRQGEVVTYRIDLHTLPYPAHDAVIWDALPPGVDKGDVSGVSDLGTAYDPGDPGYPAGIHEDYDDRSVIVWEGVDVLYDALEGESRHTLTYDVTIPSPMSVQTGLENEASVISYAGGINTSSNPAAVTYYPSNSLDDSLQDDWNTPGDSTRDTSEVHLPEVSVDKDVTSPVDTNNGGDQLVKGEVADYTLSVTIPAQTSVMNATLEDSFTNASVWQVVAASTYVTHPEGSTAAGADGDFTVNGQTLSIDTATGELSFGAVYNNSTGSAQTFTVHLQAYIKPSSALTHDPGTPIANLARLSPYTASGDEAVATVYLLEPDPYVQKWAGASGDGDNGVTAGQSLTYTVRAANTAGRPTSYDTVVVDCVPAGLGVDTGSFSATQGSASVVADPSCATGTRIVWQVGAIQGGASEDLTYDVTVSPAAASGAQYQNDATVTGYSLDDPLADRAFYQGTADDTVTVIGGGIAKGASPGFPSIGETVTYTVEIDLPANVNFYDVAVLDTLPTGITYASTLDVVCANADTTDCLGGIDVAGDPMTASGSTIGWWFDDITASGQDRTLTITYQATVADIAGNTHNTTRTNTARWRWSYSDDTGTEPANASYNPGEGEESDTASVTIRLPNPSLSKTVNDSTVNANQTLTYTITASNAANRSTLYDTVVVDCVPATFTNVGSLTPAQGSASIVPDVSCSGTRIVWDLGSLPASTSRTLTYQADVDPAAAAGATYTNTAGLTGYTADDPLADHREYTRSANRTVTVNGGSLDKSVDAATATIGQERDYTVAITVPANINFFDAILIDAVPAGLAVDSSDFSVTCQFSGGADCLGTLPTTVAVGDDGSTVGWWLGDITANATARTITVAYTGVVEDVVGSDAGDALGNTARFRWSHTDDIAGPPADASFNPGDGQYSDTASVSLVEPVVGIVKRVNTVDAIDVEPGDDFSYTVTVTNTGTSTAYDVTVVDTVPTGVVVDEGSISDGGVLSGEHPANGGGTITWTLASLAVGGGSAVTLEYDAALAPSSTLDETTLTNTASVDQYFSHPTGAGYDDAERREYPASAVEADADVTPLFPALSVTKTPTGSIAYIGQAHTFTIVVTNTGDAAAYEVGVEDTLPTGWVYDAGSTTVGGAPAADPGVSGQVLTWSDIADLAVDASVELAYTARPSTGHAWTALNTGAAVAHTNDVTVAALDGSDAPGNLDGDYEADASATVRIHKADLTIEKSHTGDPVAGEEFTWTLVVTNLAGSDPAVGPIVIEDQLPADAQFVEIDGAGWSSSGPDGGNLLTLTHAGPLAAGSDLTVQVTVSFAADIADETDATNTASVTATTFDPDPDNNDDTDPAEIDTQADVELIKTALGTSYTAGEDISWTIEVVNHGPSVSHAPLTVVDTLPASVDWGSVSTSGTGWSCGAVDGGTGEITCEWTGSPLGVDDSAPLLTITAEVLPSWTTTVFNTATVTPTTPEPSVPGTSNNTDSTTTGSVDTRADLSIDKSVASASLPAAGTGRYRIEVANEGGPSDALNVIVTDQLPAGLAYAGNLTSDGGHTWSCAPDGVVVGEVDCQLTSGFGTLVPDETTWFEFDVAIGSGVVGMVVNEATVSSDTEDENPDNDTDDAQMEAFVETNLSIAKQHDGSPVYRVGDQVVFTVTVTNDGPADARDVVVTDFLPDGLTYVGVDNDAGWTVTGPNVDNELTLTLDDPLVADTTPTTASIDVIVEIGPDAFPDATNIVEVATSTDETDDTDNDAQDEVEVDSPDLEIVKTASVEITEGGESFTYTLEVSNVDDDARADDVTVTDAIPADLRVVDDPADIGAPDWACTLTGQDGDGYGGTLECVLATLAAASDAPDIVFEAEVLATVSRDSVPNTATVASDDEHADQVDALNESSDTVLIRWIDFSGASVCVADVPWFEYTIDARNVDDGLAVTLTWYPDHDADGVPDGAAVHTDTLEVTSTDSPISGEILWPGAAVDEHGVGIAWPGWRVVTAGETPGWENMILDPSLPEYALRDGALIVVSINPESGVTSSYPPATVACEEVREPDLVVSKTASGESFQRNETVTYTINVTNNDYGATNDVVLTDNFHANLRVLSVTLPPSTDPTVADWADPCTLTGQDADGYGGMLSCELDGWLGRGQTTPDILVETALRPDAEVEPLMNMASVAWTDPDGDPDVSFSHDDTAVIVIVLAATGLGVWGMLAWAVALLAAGALLRIYGIRRRPDEA